MPRGPTTPNPGPSTTPETTRASTSPLNRGLFRSLADASVRTMTSFHSPSNTSPCASRFPCTPGRTSRPTVSLFLVICFLRTRHNDRAAGMADDRVGDTAHQRPADNAPTPSAHDDQVGLQLFGQVNHFFCHLSYPEVRSGHGPTGDPYRPVQLPESL